MNVPGTGGVAALVLAAGAGTRFGEGSKLLADLDGRPVLDHVLLAIEGAATVARAVVVIGSWADEVRPVVEARPVEVVVCEDWADGQAASLRRGLEALEDEPRVLVLVGDQPGVTAAAIDRMAEEPPGSRAAYGGTPGHPAVLGEDLIAAARKLEGDRGLRDVTRWRLVECGDLASGADVDTPADLEAIRRSRAGGR